MKIVLENDAHCWSINKTGSGSILYFIYFLASLDTGVIYFLTNKVKWYILNSLASTALWSACYCKEQPGKTISNYEKLKVPLTFLINGIYATTN